MPPDERSPESMTATWGDALDAETRGSTEWVASQDGRSPQVPGLTVMFHPDPRRVGARLAMPELVAQREVALSRAHPLFFEPGAAQGRPLLDSHLSRTPFAFMGTAEGGVRVERRDHRGKITIGSGPLDRQRDLSSQDLETGVPILLAKRILLWLHRQDPVTPDLSDLGLVGHSPSMTRLRREILRAAELDVSVLIRGESGSGKELVAQAVHERSLRRSKPLVALNMATLPPSLAASELFGSAKGAFTGATARAGFFQRADGGSLFLDEIGETPTDVQAMLLRSLETQEIQPVGAVSPRQVDVRVLAATDADLDEAIEEGRFRLPLLHRLAGYEIHLPPLRQRRDDIPRLLLHFLRQEVESLGHRTAVDLAGPNWLSADRMAELVAYDWPGNVRELRNVARRMAVRGEDNVLLRRPRQPRATTAAVSEPSVEDTDATLPTGDVEGAPARRPSYRKPSEVSDEDLLEALEAHRWQLKPTAEALGVSRASLYVMIEACDGVRKAVDLSEADILAVRDRYSGDLAAMAQALRVSEQGLKRRMTALGLR